MAMPKTATAANPTPIATTTAALASGTQSAALPASRARTPNKASKKAPKTAAAAASQPKATTHAQPLPAGKPAPLPATKPLKAGKASKKAARPRPQLVRDGFTMPQEDFALIGALKARTMAAQRETKKSELLRAGLRALAALDDKALLALLGQLAPVQIGRPKKVR